MAEGRGEGETRAFRSATSRPTALIIRRATEDRRRRRRLSEAYLVRDENEVERVFPALCSATAGALFPVALESNERERFPGEKSTMLR